jgi:hypothetical protein
MAAGIPKASVAREKQGRVKLQGWKRAASSPLRFGRRLQAEKSGHATAFERGGRGDSDPALTTMDE